MKIWYKVIPLLSVVMACGCASNNGYHQFYAGQARPNPDVALIAGHYSYRNGSIANDMLRIVEIDQVRLPRERGKAEGVNVVSVLPGSYMVKVLYVHGYEDLDFYAYKTMPINVVGGCSYEITAGLTMPTKVIEFDVVATSLMGHDANECWERRENESLEASV